MTLDTNPEADTADEQRRFCQQVATRSIHLMLDAGVPMTVALDIMFTAAGAQAALAHGSDELARQLRLMADRVESGVFHQLTGEGGAKH